MDIDLEGLEDVLEDENAEAPCLDNLTFVISGEFETVSRPKLETLIKENGGRVTSAVSGKTNYLIVGYKLEDGREVTQGSKYASAKKNGTTILTEKEFEDFMKKMTKNEEYTISQRKAKNFDLAEEP